MMATPEATRDNLSGGCLCGAVRFRADGVPATVAVCHCGICQRWSGGPTIAPHTIGEVRLEADESLTWYRSSDWAERGFCSRCGSSLFYRLLETGQMLPATGSFDDPNVFQSIDSEIFVEEQPEFYKFAGDQPRLTGEEFLAAVGLEPAGEEQT